MIMKFYNIIIYSFSFICACCFVSNTNASLAEESTYTAAEKKSLVKFRNLVKEHLYQDYMHRDEYLITWLRTKNLDVNQARDMLLKALKWRKENKMDSINEEEFPQFQGFKFDTQGRDKDGRPVLVILLPTWNIRKAVLAGERQNVTRYYTKVLLEEPSRLAREIGQANGSNSTQVVVITELTGYSLRQQGCVACLPFFVAILQNHEYYYPQFYKETIATNAPSIFNAILQVTKPFWSDRFVKHVHVLGYDKNEIRQLLTRFVPLDQIPVQLGGTRKIA